MRVSPRGGQWYNWYAFVDGMGRNGVKTIGLIGGMSWESTVTYYQVVNQVVKRKLGGLHSAKCVLVSVDFEEIEACQAKGEWGAAAAILARAAQSLEMAGANCVVICTNTMHKVAGEVQRAVSIPVLHIAEMTADVLLARGIARVGLLGTKYTMEQDFYKSRLVERGLAVLIPETAERARLNDIIFGELCLGKIEEESRRFVLGLVDGLGRSGAEGVILGCTEIGLLLRQRDTEVPLFDTALIHARGAALYALGKTSSGHTSIRIFDANG